MRATSVDCRRCTPRWLLRITGNYLIDLITANRTTRIRVYTVAPYFPPTMAPTSKVLVIPGYTRISIYLHLDAPDTRDFLVTRFKLDYIFLFPFLLILLSLKPLTTIFTAALL